MYKQVRIPRQIGQAVKDKRIRLGYTQAQLAELSNTSRSLVYRLEKGATNGISLDKLFAILNALGLELAVIDEDKATKSIERITSDLAVDDVQKKPKEQSISPKPNREKKIKASPARNTQAQYDKEIEAAGNIPGFDVLRYLRK